MFFFAFTALESKLRTTLEIVMASIVSLLPKVESHVLENRAAATTSHFVFSWFDRSRTRVAPGSEFRPHGRRRPVKPILDFGCEFSRLSSVELNSF